MPNRLSGFTVGNYSCCHYCMFDNKNLSNLYMMIIGALSTDKKLIYLLILKFALLRD